MVNKDYDQNYRRPNWHSFYAMYQLQGLRVRLKCLELTRLSKACNFTENSIFSKSEVAVPSLVRCRPYDSADLMWLKDYFTII